ncbi:hypothetical protein BJ508DRAFT_414513 [Ascobolus immersus RN42]|uniref:PCI domain-containing protein n=1 Tax=Ascobolus immersus RN42 TaxID=1160509 RepID=A0A3N4I6U1_ASCIM|nr:hypothetical protein BJ508DRAFT_414513 [Ascobolus immersus RN42]
MSDDDFMVESNDEYDFDYSENDDENEGQTDFENRYYNAKQLKDVNVEKALDAFAAIIEAENPSSEWSFRSRKQTIKLLLIAGSLKEALAHFKDMFLFIGQTSNRIYAEKSLTNILDLLTSNVEQVGFTEVEVFFNTALSSLRDSSSDRLWLKVKLKLAKLMLDTEHYIDLSRSVKEIYQLSSASAANSDPAASGFLLDVYALEMQMASRIGNAKLLKALYRKALSVRLAVPHPKIMGIVREYGGKMHMEEENWSDAQKDFYEAFRNYDEAGKKERIKVLKYLIVSIMLTNSEINPFDSQELKPFLRDDEINPFVCLLDAYQRKDYAGYEKVFRRYEESISLDRLLSQHLFDVRRNLRLDALQRLVAPFSTISSSAVGEYLGASEWEVVNALTNLLLEGHFPGKLSRRFEKLSIQGIRNERLVTSHGLERAVIGLLQSGRTGASFGMASEECCQLTFCSSFQNPQDYQVA